MRRLLVVIMAICSVAVCSADERSQSVLRSVAGYVQALGEYEAEFDVAAGDYRTNGRYGVLGDTYHIEVAQAEVYSDGKARYEVDHDRREVNIDVMDLASRNILDNPTRCFDFVGDDYSAQIYSEAGGNVTLLLRANDEAIEGDIYLTVDSATGRPRKIAYVLYDDRIEVTIVSLERRKNAVKRYDESKYKGYEIVDFR
jgi:hypothetical protein